MTLARELESLSPFGKGNPTPLFASKSIQVKELRLIGKNKDILKLLLFEPASEQYLPAVSFDGYEQLRIMLQKLYPDKDCDTILAGGKLAEPLDIVYTVDINTYKGESSVQLLLKDFRFAEGSKARA